MARKWECQNLLNCHLAISCSWIDYHTSSERGDSGVSADPKKFEFFIQMAIFKHIFELLWGLPNCTHNWVCHSVTSSQISDYHTPIWRGYPELSYEPKCLKISFQIRELELGETYMWEIPRTSSTFRQQFSRLCLGNGDGRPLTPLSPRRRFTLLRSRLREEGDNNPHTF